MFCWRVIAEGSRYVTVTLAVAAKQLAPLQLRHSPSSIKDNISFQAVRSAVTVLYSDGHQTMY